MLLGKKLVIIFLVVFSVLVLKDAVGACTENWYCSGWTVCKDDIQTRVCVDLNDCGTIKEKPNSQKSCEEPIIDGGEDDDQDTMVATCSDGIQNQGEEGVDSGGPCVRKCVSTPLFFLWILIPVVLVWQLIKTILYGLVMFIPLYISSVKKYKRLK